MSLSHFKVLVFDCYGTLIDWESGMDAKLGPLLTHPKAPSRADLFGVLGRHETRIQTETPEMLYPEVLYNTYKAVGEELGLDIDEDAAREFGDSIPSWPAFPDSAKALKKLQDSGLKLVILSNVNVEGFAASRKKLEAEGAKFDAVYLAENIGSYKPSLNNFEYMLKHIAADLGITDKQDVLITANSLLHDVEPGHKMRLKSAWIQRSVAVMGVSGRSEKPDFSFEGMEKFAEAMVQARSSRA